MATAGWHMPAACFEMYSSHDIPPGNNLIGSWPSTFSFQKGEKNMLSKGLSDASTVL